MNKKLNILFFAFAVLLILPTVALADITWFSNAVGVVVEIVKIVFYAAAVIYFLVYGIMFLMARGDPGKTKEARSGVLWGVVGVIVGIIGLQIITFVTTTFL